MMKPPAPVPSPPTHLSPMFATAGRAAGVVLAELFRVARDHGVRPWRVSKKMGER